MCEGFRSWCWVKALGPMLEFFDIAASWVDPPLDELVSGVGYPVSYGVRLKEKSVGPITHKAVLLSPTAFNGNVLTPPVGDELKFKFGGFNSDRHYLIPFEHAKEGKRPEGISGAAAWVQSSGSHALGPRDSNSRGPALLAIRTEQLSR